MTCRTKSLGNNQKTRFKASSTPLDGVRRIRQKLMIWKLTIVNSDFTVPGPVMSV